MQGRTKKAVCLLTVVAVLAGGCTWIEEHQKTAIGAGAGAVAGGLIGAAAGDEEAALAGAAVGALAGGAIGAYLDHKDKSAEETYEEYDYSARQGVDIAEAAASVEPKTASPGQQIDLEARYALLAPNSRQQIEVKEERTISVDGEMVITVPDTDTKTPGTYTTNRPIDLPPDARTGTYTYELTVTAEQAIYRTSTTFTVQ
ncbi:MAG: glycine zipper domain-containing protein [Planctomycetota bacterium]